MISFKQLEAIHWVAQLGTFAAAAGKLHTSESAISKRISELEAVFELQLFDRTLRSARLTRRGMEVVEFAKTILEQRNQLLERMGKSNLVVQRFRVGVTELVALTWLPRLVEAFREAYPGISFEPEVDLSTVLCEKLERGDIDLIVVPPVFRAASLMAVPLRKLDLAWMCKPGLVPARKTLPLTDMVQFPVVAQSGRSGVDTFYDEWFREHGVAVKKVYAGNSLVALAALTAAGFGISYLPALYFKDSIKRGVLQQIRSDVPAPSVDYHAVYRTDDEMSGFCESVAELCLRMCDFSKPDDAPVVSSRLRGKHEKSSGISVI